MDAPRRRPRLSEPHQVAGDVVGLYDVLRVGWVAGVAPTGELDVDLAVIVSWIVIPGEQTKNDVRVEVVDDRVQIESVRAITQRSLVDDLGALPLGAGL